MAEGTASKPKGKKLKNSKTDEFGAKKAVCNEVVHFYRAALSERPQREARWGRAFTRSRQVEILTPGIRTLTPKWPVSGNVTQDCRRRALSGAVSISLPGWLGLKIFFSCRRRKSLSVSWGQTHTIGMLPINPPPRAGGAALWDRGGVWAPAWNTRVRQQALSCRVRGRARS